MLDSDSDVEVEEAIITSKHTTEAKGADQLVYSTPASEKSSARITLGNLNEYTQVMKSMQKFREELQKSAYGNDEEEVRLINPDIDDFQLKDSEK